MSKYKFSKLVLCFTVFIFFSCNNNKSEQTTEDRYTSDTLVNKLNPTTNTETNLKVGGIYSIREKDSTYSISKILVIDGNAVHVRIYSNKFKSKPIKIKSDTLAILIGHAPMDKLGFLLSNPELLNVEKVRDSEMEGYKLYIKEMDK